MLHNSTFRRELLREMNHNSLVLARREVHRNVGLGPGAAPAAGQVQVSGAWSVRPGRDLPAERAVAKEAEGCFRRLDVTVYPAAKQEILLEVGSAESGFRCVVGDGRVEVHGADAAALWAGWVHLENEMRISGAAIVTRGEVRR